MTQTLTTKAGGNELQIITSDGFSDWLATHQVSLACSTYQSGKLFLIGTNPQRALSVYERTFDRCMGICATAQTLYLSTIVHIWRFENALSDGQSYQEYDHLYVPQMGYTTGDLDIHDMAIDQDGRLIFINTLFSCVATVSDQHSFVPLWTPPFISKLAAEDRCHLNGLAMRDGKPRYVTAVACSDSHEGWREGRRAGGVVIDLQTNQTILDGLSMPHSPRWHQDRLWVLNSGAGYLGEVSLPLAEDQTGSFEPLTFCPGYARGLNFMDDYAVIGLSKRRGSQTFTGLDLDQNLQSASTEDRCGLLVVDLNSGQIAHTLWFEGVVEELYDVAILPDVKRPMALGFRHEEIRRCLTFEE